MSIERSGRGRGLAGRIGALGMLALIGATACGGGAETTAGTAAVASPTGTIDPCALVTAAEAADALGAQSAEPDRPAAANIPPGLVTCRYVAQRGQGVAVLTVMVRTGSESESRIGFESAREQFAAAQPAEGLGDDAFVLGDQLHVRKGPVHLQISGDIPGDVARRLAETALGRLG